MLVWLLVAVGCEGSSTLGARPMVEGEGFFDRPFPSDERLVAGHPDLTGYPGQGRYLLVDSYVELASTLDGWGTNSPVYVRFQDTLPTGLLPTEAESRLLESPVMLLDVDRQSPHRGERIPIRFEYTEAGTEWQPDHFLAVAPVFGFPLRPATQYALVFRSPLVATGVWSAEDAPLYRPMEETLLTLGIDPASIALGVVFTTQDPVREMARISRAIHEEIGHVPFEPELTTWAERDDHTVYTGNVTVPIWQHGERPYRTDGGGLLFDDDGAPVIAAWERIHFALTVPNGEQPAAGWPVVLYSHGTGGDYLTFCGRGSPDEEGPVMAGEGVAMIGISQPLHDDRAPPGTNPEYDSFNYLNPVSGRTNFRQGALDQVYLARLLTERAAELEVDSGGTVRLDPARVAYFGHSQGGLVGAIAAPYFSSDIVAAGFSGTGGGLSMTLVLRKDPIDISGWLEALLQFSDDEVLTPFHPVAGLIQMLTEVTDPINYGPWWFAEEPAWPARPIPILLTEGSEDAATPSVTTEALATSARVPIVGNAFSAPVSQDLRGLGNQPLPVEQNAEDWNDDPITAGLGQFDGYDHYAIYYSREAKRLYRDFLVTGLDGGPRLDE